jgi:hypothetical protein
MALLSAPQALAVIPNADRTMKAIAQVNRAAGRTKAIQLELTMRVGDQPAVAVGELISHPSGLARLELRGFNGRVDRYLLSGTELLATKDGQPLDHPQPMLQPYFLLQPDSETTLRAALETFGIRSEWIGLATCGDQDCFVLGDPRLAAPLPKPPVAMEMLDADVLGDPLEGRGSTSGSGSTAETRPGYAAGNRAQGSGDSLVGPELELPEDGFIPRIWVETRDLQVVRIDRGDGLFLRLGPIVAFEKLQVPGWFEIHQAGEQVIRFEVGRAVQVNAPPQAFSHKWLLAPVMADPTTAPASPTTPSAAPPAPPARR